MTKSDTLMRVKKYKELNEQFSNLGYLRLG
jgi:hypothetical protein